MDKKRLNISNVVLVHGSNPNDREKMKSGNLLPQNERGWLGWIKKELEERGIDCICPLMPRNWAPTYSEWKEEFEKIKIDGDSVLVGWSTGAAFLIRWLGEFEINVNRLILVAPVTGKERCNDWINRMGSDIDSKIKERVSDIVIFVSDNEEEERIDSANIYSSKLGGTLIELEGRGHFTEKNMGTKEFPELLEGILR